MNIGKALRQILLDDATISATLGQRIAPLIAGQNVALPYCIYRVVNITPVNIHTFVSPLDVVNVEFTVFTEDYNEATTIATQVRAVLDYYAGTAKGVKIAHCSYAGTREDINEAGRLIAHTVFFTIHAKQLVTQTQQLAGILSATATAICNVRALQYLQATTNVNVSATANATIAKKLGAVLGAYATATCAIGIGNDLAALVSLSGTGTTAATIAKKLAASLNATASATLNVVVYQAQLIAANVSISGTATLTANIYKQIAANVAANATGVLNVSVGTGLDADAQAFITATGITDTTQKNAVNQLVLDLKSYSLWSKMPAIYPMVGGTAATHKFNLKDPRDLDAAYRLVFSGGWTHSASGAQPNGTNGYADTKFTPTNARLTDFSFGYYGNTNETAFGARTQIGSSVGNGQAYAVLMTRYNGSSALVTCMWSGDVFSGLTNGNSSTGLYLATATATNTQALYKNGSLVSSFTRTTPANAAALNIYLGAANNNGSVAWYSDTRQALAFMGQKMNSTEQSNFYTAVQAFQTSLSRNV